MDNIVDVDDREETRATIGLRGEGTFVWRVAAYNKVDTQGPWSSLQRFRVAARLPMDLTRRTEFPDSAVQAADSDPDASGEGGT